MRGRKGCKENAAEEAAEEAAEYVAVVIACGRGRDDARLLEEKGLHLCT